MTDRFQRVGKGLPLPMDNSINSREQPKSRFQGDARRPTT